MYLQPNSLFRKPQNTSQFREPINLNEKLFHWRTSQIQELQVMILEVLTLSYFLSSDTLKVEIFPIVQPRLSYDWDKWSKLGILHSIHWWYNLVEELLLNTICFQCVILSISHAISSRSVSNRKLSLNSVLFPNQERVVLLRSDFIKFYRPLAPIST